MSARGRQGATMIGVDVGGTNTDVVGIRGGEIVSAKVPSRSHESELSVLEGTAAVGSSDAALFNHASTAGLNAVLTRRLPKVGFLTSAGHRDMLDMGRALRPVGDLTNPRWRRPFGDVTAPLVERYLRRGVVERITADGTVLIPLDVEQARAEIELLARCGVEGIAICLLNAYISDEHELLLREIVEEVMPEGFHCSISSEISPLAKEYPRASTTVLDVMMKSVYSGYTERLSGGLRDQGFAGQLNFADGAAMLTDSEFAMTAPHRIVFAGPAAGTVASAHFGSSVGLSNLLCVDVGGTSCDISIVIDGDPNLATYFELEHDLIVNGLATEISSIGAGGGSIVSVTRAGELQVGPDSAGADPGPACTGKGGERPTMTDACLLLGILDPERFLGGRVRLQPELAERAFAALPTRLTLAQRVEYAYRIGLNQIAEGVVAVALKNGVDPRDHTLVAYGAAGPMLIPATLSLCGARGVVVPPHPGLFSALGLLSTDLVYADSRTAYVDLEPANAERIDAIFRELESRLLDRLTVDPGDAVVSRSFDGQLVGQGWETTLIDAPQGPIDAGAIAAMTATFHDVYEQRTGNRFEAIPVQSVTYRVQATLPTAKLSFPLKARGAGAGPSPTRSIQLRTEGGERNGYEYERDELCPGDSVEGPAVIREDTSTTHIIAGQKATVGDFGELVIERA